VETITGTGETDQGVTLDGCTVVSNKIMKDLCITLDPDLSLTKVSIIFKGQLLFIFVTLQKISAK
jgi:hypothetical protein